MGVPKNKTSKANRRMNRAGRYADFTATAVSLCPQLKLRKWKNKILNSSNIPSTCG